MIYDLKSEVSGDYGKALLILAEVLYIVVVQWCARKNFKQTHSNAFIVDR